jgi:hypothetical protein
MTKCSNCNLEVYSLHIDGRCFRCWMELHPEIWSVNPVARDLMEKMNQDYLNEGIMGVDMKKKFLKVQFFEDISLITIQNQMNKFFEDEKITTVTRIEYLKDSNNRYSVMVVYQNVI